MTGARRRRAKLLIDGAAGTIALANNSAQVITPTFPGSSGDPRPDELRSWCLFRGRLFTNPGKNKHAVLLNIETRAGEFERLDGSDVAVFTSSSGGDAILSWAFTLPVARWFLEFYNGDVFSNHELRFILELHQDSPD